MQRVVAHQAENEHDGRKRLDEKKHDRGPVRSAGKPCGPERPAAATCPASATYRTTTSSWSKTCSCVSKSAPNAAKHRQSIQQPRVPTRIKEPPDDPSPASPTARTAGRGWESRAVPRTPTPRKPRAPTTNAPTVTPPNAGARTPGPPPPSARPANARKPHRGGMVLGGRGDARRPHVEHQQDQDRGADQREDLRRPQRGPAGKKTSCRACKTSMPKMFNPPVRKKRPADDRQRTDDARREKPRTRRRRR